ncbi:hypothetical protein QEN19_000897 [Hanseniaspora menglaensis]
MSMPSSFDRDDQDEVNELVYHELVWKKIKENPFVPVGMLATFVAVTTAIVKMKSGNKESANVWFRWRVIAQAATIGSLAFGAMYQQRDRFLKDSNMTLEEMQTEKIKNKAKEREKLWIEELERRDTAIQQRKELAELKKIELEKIKNESSKIVAELKELEERVKEKSSKK